MLAEIVALLLPFLSGISAFLSWPLFFALERRAGQLGLFALEQKAEQFGLYSECPCASSSSCRSSYAYRAACFTPMILVYPPVGSTSNGAGFPVMYDISNPASVSKS